ncbi:uncharacterized protein LOC130899871 [Diorhabda carinulata]|uniref:uncharacterized protein LOC130450144 n=1 Tax=Diorhabda sublineata TaxID=1163346 RepID=UPI0024E077FA|nr:uncharacterized protein LOC130450144 [Diorhabda sublineata]XP_057666016.1 uncharacterized protein LOC130899871 [Diorhabda carinulata]XP_057666017.1 uncharacterized protein LOC130899871 [Diorhabda carinulata]
MRWLNTSIPFVILLALGYYTRLAASLSLFNRYPENYDDENHLDRNTIEEYQYAIRPRKMEDERLEEAMRVLSKLLILPWPSGESPFIYIESPRKPIYNENTNIPDIIGEDGDGIGPTPSKRMRYYRKYPWKRENMGYDPENPFVCYPSKSEIHRLLVALHDTRYNGYKGSPVEFCSRKRPAHTILTNMHFSGK